MVRAGGPSQDRAPLKLKEMGCPLPAEAQQPCHLSDRQIRVTSASNKLGDLDAQARLALLQRQSLGGDGRERLPNEPSFLGETSTSPRYLILGGHAVFLSPCQVS